VGNWRTTDTVAWTTRDGHTPPPKGVSATLLGGIATGLVGVWLVLVSVDALCPEHRQWVQALGITACASAAVAVVGLVRSTAWGPLCALASSLLGVAVGVIDAVHSPLRGTLVTLGFVALTTVLFYVAWHMVVSRWWVRRVHNEAAVDDMAPALHHVAPAGRPKASSTRTDRVRRESRDSTLID
jgi:hypothetical protein